MKKKIVFLFPHFGVGGIPKALNFVAGTCAKSGYDTCCIALRESKESISFHNSIQHYCLVNVKDASLLHSNLYKILIKIKIFFKLVKVLKKENPNIICVFGADNVRIAVMATILQKIKIIGSERGDPGRYSKKQYKRYSKAYQKCCAVVFQTEYASNYFSQEIKGKSLIIANPSMSPSMLVNDVIRTNTIIGCGRLSPEKNFPMLIDAFYKISRTYPQLNLRIYGEGDEKAALDKLITYYKIQDKVDIIEGTTQVFQKEYNCLMFVLTSNQEGMPNVLLEAMSMGIPCIATNTPSGGVSSIMRGGERGLLIPVGNTESLVRAMTQYIEQPDLAQKYGAKGREVTEEFSPEKIAACWLELIKKIC